MLATSSALRDRAVCQHAFACWYRVEGRCCHGTVTEPATCSGQTPATLLTLGLLRDPGARSVADAPTDR